MQNWRGRVLIALVSSGAHAQEARLHGNLDAARAIVNADPAH
jgi:hypothetical protein